MQNKMFSKTTSLLLIATMTLAFAGTVSAVDVNEIGANGLPEFLSDDLGSLEKGIDVYSLKGGRQ